MRRLISLAFIAALLSVAFSLHAQVMCDKSQLCPAGGGGGANTWTNVQIVSNASCTSCTTLNVTVASTGTNHLLMAEVIYTNGTTGGITSITGGGTWTIDTGCNKSTSGSFGGSACAYVPCTSTSGTTTIAFTFSASNSYAVGFYEESASTGSCVKDTSGSTSATGTTVGGVALTLTGTSDALFQFIDESGGSATISSISSPYTLNGQTTNPGSGTAGFASQLNGSSGAAPTWTFTASEGMSGGAIAFK